MLKLNVWVGKIDADTTKECIYFFAVETDLWNIRYSKRGAKIHANVCQNFAKKIHPSPVESFPRATTGQPRRPGARWTSSTRTWNNMKPPRKRVAKCPNCRVSSRISEVLCPTYGSGQVSCDTG